MYVFVSGFYVDIIFDNTHTHKLSHRSITNHHTTSCEAALCSYDSSQTLLDSGSTVLCFITIIIEHFCSQSGDDVASLWSSCNFKCRLLVSASCGKMSKYLEIFCLSNCCIIFDFSCKYKQNNHRFRCNSTSFVRAC